MPLSRRSVASGIVALAATSILPADLLADPLTADERAFLARHRVRLTGVRRARALAAWRGADSATRRVLWWICDLSVPKLEQLLDVLYAMEDGAPEDELAMLRERFVSPDPDGVA